MTQAQKNTLNRWAPTLIQVAIMLTGLGVMWGSLTTKLDGVSQRQDDQSEELKYLRSRIDRMD